MPLDLKNKPVPFNGRIAIVDDKIEQSMPLIELFGKHQFPYLYYSGNINGLPEEGKTFNDIRILFLDIYLTGEQIRSKTEIKSTIYSVINRLISENNYPYLLIYWSRHENEHGEIVESLFQNELSKKQPINILSIQKSDFFSISGEKTEDFDEKILGLISRIEKAIEKYPIFNYLIRWENLIHISADKTLEDIFKTEENHELWNDNSKYLFFKLASSFAGKNLVNFSAIDKIKNAFYSLNQVFIDSLEYSISTLFSGNFDDLDASHTTNPNILFTLNKKILLSDGVEDKYLSGMVYKIESEKHNYSEILNFSINRNFLFEKNKENICERIKEIVETKVLKKEKKKVQNEIMEKLKSDIKQDFVSIEINVTPICDYVQCKCVYYRMIPGLIINSKYFEYFNKLSEAIYISPFIKVFSNSAENYFLLFDFRFFTSISKNEFNEKMIPIFKIRQNLLSEIQSRLSRHINRQGILFLEE